MSHVLNKTTNDDYAKWMSAIYVYILYFIMLLDRINHVWCTIRSMQICSVQHTLSFIDAVFEVDDKGDLQ